LYCVLWRDAEFAKIDDYIPFVTVADFNKKICFEKFLAYLDEKRSYHIQNPDLPLDKWYGCVDCEFCGNDYKDTLWDKYDFFVFFDDFDHYCYGCSVFIFTVIKL